jgi:hypothetical protein
MQIFVTDAVLKRDVFSETHKGHFEGEPARPVIRRIVTASPLWSRPLAWFLARREIAALAALQGVKGTPQLISTDSHGLYRRWTEGAPLHLARPADRQWYRDAFRLLRQMRRMGITHNDLAKPQNWLQAPDGSAEVIDFQLASVHRRRGWLFKLMAYEDFRHLLKQMRRYAPHLLTPTGKRIFKKRSPISRAWRVTGKPLYNMITRGFGWSDGDGTGDRIDREGQKIVATLMAEPGVEDVVLTHFPLPKKGTGIYAFAEAPLVADPQVLGRLTSADLVQAVAALPRRPDGGHRLDLLSLVAMNQIPELEARLVDEPEIAETMRAIANGRLNYSDRRIVQHEPGYNSNKRKKGWISR